MYINTVGTVVAAFAAVIAATCAKWTAREAVKALRRPQLSIRPSYRSADGNYQIELTEDGNAAITFDLSNGEENRATDVKVYLKIPGFMDAGLEGGNYIRLDLNGYGKVPVGNIPRGDSSAIGAVVARAVAGAYRVHWYIISNEGRWPAESWHSEDIEVIPNASRR